MPPSHTPPVTLSQSTSDHHQPAAASPGSMYTGAHCWCATELLCCSRAAGDSVGKARALFNPLAIPHCFHPQVLRVKNRFSLGYDSAQSAGYRDVGVNLRICTPSTRALGAAVHVCELQLILRPFAELKVLCCLQGLVHVHERIMWSGRIGAASLSGYRSRIHQSRDVSHPHPRTVPPVTLLYNTSKRLPRPMHAHALLCTCTCSHAARGGTEH
jgi:hypothetical protein